MKKKDWIIFIIFVVVVLGAVGGYYAYKQYLKNHEPNLDVVNEKMVIATGDDGLATGNEAQYLNVTTDAEALYPTLSGGYEPIWDDFESIGLNVKCDSSDINQLNDYLFEGTGLELPAYVEGDDSVSASYKVIWSKRYLYFQVIVKDKSKTTSGFNYFNQDSVEFFINEDGNKNSTLLVGDAVYIVYRDNVKSTGFGADDSFESITYELPLENGEYTGYVVEAIIPLLTIKATKNSSIGFDIQVNNARGGRNVATIKWASPYIYSFQNFAALGTLTFK